MRVGLVSSAVPLVGGGYRMIVDWLSKKLVERGIEVEVIYLPFVDAPQDVLSQMAAYRLIRLDEHFDRIITFRPPAHVVQHRCKIVWFIHHIRIFYDLWETKYCPIPHDNSGLALRASLIQADTAALGEAHKVFTNSSVVGDRLRKFNNVESKVLFPPILQPERFHSGPVGNEIVSICRMEEHKRQHLMVEALGLTSQPVRLVLCGDTMSPDYVAGLRETARRLGVEDRLVIEDRWISEEEKVERLANALACAYLPIDEDSYGYPTLEAAHSCRPIITTSDSGGVTEFVRDGVNGLLTAPTAAAIAGAFDQLYSDRILAARLGAQASNRIADMGIDWGTVLDSLLA